MFYQWNTAFCCHHEGWKIAIELPFAGNGEQCANLQTLTLENFMEETKGEPPHATNEIT